MLSKDALIQLQEGAAITQANAAIVGINDLGVIALPDSFNTKDLEQYMPARRRARGTMTTSRDEDFAEYVKLHKENGAAVFVDAKLMSATAVLNLGDPGKPGHADNEAILSLRQTAAYIALLSHADGRAKTQVAIAEFLEDWQHIISCLRGENESIPVARAISAVRKITIEAMRKLENEERQLSATQSTFSQVTATSTEPIPTLIQFKCVPYLGMKERTFAIRLGILTGQDKPQINLRIVKQEQHDEEMAQELADRVRVLLKDTAAVAIGKYEVTK